MSNTVENQIARLEQELATLKEIVNKPKEKWIPSYRTGSLAFEIDLPMEKENGVYYETHEKAENAKQDVIQYMRMRRFAHERNQGWKPNWSNTNASKFCISYSHYGHKWMTSVAMGNEDPTSIYFRNKTDAEELVDLLNKGLF
jgi:hypothetical protein